MKRPLYWLMLTLLLVVMSELQTMGMLPEMARSLGASTAAIGAYISLYSFGMAVGGPLIAWTLRLIPPKTALLGVVIAYAVLEAAVPLVHDYWWVAMLRLLTGTLGGAVFGLTLTMAARLAPGPDRIASSISLVLNGLMLGTVLGLPISHAIATAWNWQASFALLGGAALVIALLDLPALPALPAVSAQTAADELQQFRSTRLWSRYLVSLLTIGGTYGAFSYFTPLLEEDAGFSPDTTTVILFGYGLCTVLGNHLVGRYADRHAVTVLRIGHFLLAGSLVILALFAHLPWAALPGVLLVGLVGVTMNPALVVRVVEVAGAGNLVNTVHTSVITLGVVVGSAIGGVAISNIGDASTAAAMWTGAALAILAACVLGAQSVLFDRRTAAPPHGVPVGPADGGIADEAVPVGPTGPPRHPGPTHR